MTNKKIVRIVTFYEDGTFSESVPSPYIPAQPYMPPSPYTNPYPWNPLTGPQWHPGVVYCGGFGSTTTGTTANTAL